MHSTKKTKKQHLATLHKASEDASRSDHDEFPDAAGKKKRAKPAQSTDEDKEPKKASKKSATVSIGLIHPATLRKAHEDASRSDHDEFPDAAGKKKRAEPAQSTDEDEEPKKASKKLVTVRKGILKRLPKRSS